MPRISTPAADLHTPGHLSQVLGRSRAQLRRNAWLSQDLELAIWSNSNDEVVYSLPGHHTLSVYLEGGRGSQLRGAPQNTGDAGRFCVFPSEHVSDWLVQEPVQFLHLYVSEIAWADRVVRLLDAEPRSVSLTPTIYAQDPVFSRWSQSLWQLDWTDPNDALAADTLSQHVLDHLVLRSATQRQRDGLARPMGGLSSSARRRVLDFVDAHLADSGSLTLVKLAQVAALSEYHFARMFRQSMGCTVHEWVQERRVQRARELISRSPRVPSLAQLALDCGFSSASHLLRIFRAQTGATPTQFAKARRNT